MKNPSYFSFLFATSEDSIAHEPPSQFMRSIEEEILVLVRAPE
jgi:hypothetical protein